MPSRPIPPTAVGGWFKFSLLGPPAFSHKIPPTAVGGLFNFHPCRTTHMPVEFSQPTRMKRVTSSHFAFDYVRLESDEGMMVPCRGLLPGLSMKDETPPCPFRSSESRGERLKGCGQTLFGPGPDPQHYVKTRVYCQMQNAKMRPCLFIRPPRFLRGEGGVTAREKNRFRPEGP